MQNIIFFFLTFFAPFQAVSQKAMYIYIEKYVDGKEVVNSKQQEIDVKLETFYGKRAYSLKKKGPVFVYKSSRALKNLKISQGKSSFLVTDTKILANKTLAIKLEQNSDCNKGEYAVFYDNGGYIRVIQDDDKDKECKTKINIIKPWYARIGNKWDTNYSVLLPYQYPQLVTLPQQ